MTTVNIDVDMNRLPEFVMDVFKEMRDSVFDYELLHISHSILKDDDGKVNTEFWTVIFHETGVMDSVTFIKLTCQPWNRVPLHRDYVVVPMKTLKEIMGKVDKE